MFSFLRDKFSSEDKEYYLIKLLNMRYIHCRKVNHIEEKYVTNY